MGESAHPFRGLDTRDADPDDTLRYVIEYEGPGGTTAEPAQSFGLYAPGDTPTPTPPPTTSPTTTATEPAEETDEATDTPGGTIDGQGPGFGIAVTLLALLFVAFLARSRTA